MQEIIDRLNKETNRLEFEQNMHFLKGCALSFGFDQFSKLCQDGERIAAEGKAGEVDLPAILQVYDDSKAVFLTEKDANLT